LTLATTRLLTPAKKTGIILSVSDYLVDPAIAFESLRRIVASGAEWGEVFVEDSFGWQVKREDRKTTVASSSRQGVSLYAIASGRSYHSCCDGLSPASIKRITDVLCESIRRDNPAGPDSSIEPFEVHPEFAAVVKQPPGGVEVSRKIEAVAEADDVARQAHGKVSQVTVIYRDTTRNVLIFTSEGRIGKERRILTELAVRAYLRVNGEILSSLSGFSSTRGFEAFAEAGKGPGEVAREAVRRAAVLIDARPAPEGEMPVVFAPGSPGTLFHEACGHSFEADHIQKGSSFAGKKGQQVASPLVTLVDNPTVEGSGGSFGLDDEGNLSRENLLIEGGTMVGALYDMRTAMIDGVESTGSGRCQDYEHPPIPRMSNTYLERGDAEPEAIVAGTKSGIYVKSVARGGNVDVISGNFVVGVGEGYAIENGRLTFALKNATISGNGLSVLRDIDAVGNDLVIESIGRCGKGQQVPVGSGNPTLRVRRMVVGGGKR